MPSGSNRALNLVRMQVDDQDSLIEADVTRDTLAAMINAIRGRDEAALEELYRATVAKVFGLVSKVLGVGPDAEEVTEDVYMYVWQNADRYDPDRAHPGAWLIMLARSRAIDRYRYQLKQDKISDALQKEQAIDLSDEGPLEILMDTKLHDWVDTLPQLQRQILKMAYFQGMTHAEISNELQMSLGTVKSHIRRTLLSMRAEVEA